MIRPITVHLFNNVCNIKNSGTNGEITFCAFILETSRSDQHLSNFDVNKKWNRFVSGFDLLLICFKLLYDEQT